MNFRDQISWIKKVGIVIKSYTLSYTSRDSWINNLTFQSDDHWDTDLNIDPDTDSITSHPLVVLHDVAVGRLYGSTSGPKGFFAYVDGWRAGYYDDLTDHKLGFIRRIYRQWKRLLDIGVQDRNGKVRWCKPHELVTGVSNIVLPFDFIRILGKGSSFRMNISDEKKCAWPEELLLWLKCQKYNTKKLNKKLNHVGKTALIKQVLSLKKQGWIVRKEDRGPRYVLCNIKWESDCFENFLNSDDKLERVNIETSLNQGERIGRMYFIPKTQKDNDTTPGRPIVSFRNVYSLGQENELNDLSSVLSTYAQQLGIDKVRTIDAIKTVAPGERDKVGVGDIDSMFTNVPRDMIREFLDKSELTHELFIHRLNLTNSKKRERMIKRASEIQNYYKTRIWDYVTKPMWHYNGVVVRMRDGLPMGHKISPCLARAVVSYMESKTFIPLLNVMKCRAVRYVDDVAILGVFDSSKINDKGEAEIAFGYSKLEVLKKAYQDSIRPMRITWNADTKYMDAEFINEKVIDVAANWNNARRLVREQGEKGAIFHKKGGLYFSKIEGKFVPIEKTPLISYKQSKVINPLSVELTGSCVYHTMVAEVIRRIERLPLIQGNFISDRTITRREQREIAAKKPDWLFPSEEFCLKRIENECVSYLKQVAANHSGYLMKKTFGKMSDMVKDCYEYWLSREAFKVEKERLKKERLKLEKEAGKKPITLKYDSRMKLDLRLEHLLHKFISCSNIYSRIIWEYESTKTLFVICHKTHNLYSTARST